MAIMGPRGVETGEHFISASSRNAPGGLPQKPGDGGPEAAGGLVIGVQLGVDDALSAAQSRKPFLQTAHSCQLQKGHAQLALEGATHGGRVMSQRDQIVLSPAAPWIGIEAGGKVRNERLHAVFERFTSLAGTEASRQAFGRRFMKAAVFRQRLSGRAGEATENAGGGDAHKHPPVPAGIAVEQGVIERGVGRA